MHNRLSLNVQDNVWYKDKFQIATKVTFFHLIYHSFEINEHVKCMLFIYVLTLLMYAGKLNRYEIHYFVHVLMQCNVHVKNWGGGGGGGGGGGMGTPVSSRTNTISALVQGNLYYINRILIDKFVLQIRDLNLNLWIFETKACKWVASTLKQRTTGVKQTRARWDM